MIDDLVQSKLGKFDVITTNNKADKIVIFMCDIIDKFLDEEISPQDLYNRQVALGEQNIVTILLELSDIMMMLGKDTTIRVLLTKIIRVCKDNKITQS